MNLALIYGGRSFEHDISTLSAAAVYNNLNRSRFNIIPIGIAKDGKWYYQSLDLLEKYDSLPIVEEQREQLAPVFGFKHKFLRGLGGLAGGQKMFVDAVFPLIHGKDGEDGNLQGLLEMLELPYVGAGVAAHALGMNKVKTKFCWKSEELPQLPYVSFFREQIQENYTQVEKAITDQLSFPVFVKPACGGSSFGIEKVESVPELKGALDQAIQYDVELVVEQGVVAREIEYAVVGNANKPENLIVSPAGEIVTHAAFYDYHAKYESPQDTEIIVPAKISEEQNLKAQQYAKQAYQVLGCQGYARVDFFLTEDGALYLNEINTIPGFTQMSMFPLLMKELGLSFTELLDKLIDEMINDKI